MQYNITLKPGKTPVQWKDIEIVIFDCDGTLTDNLIIYTGEVMEAKNFSVRDGLGIMLLHQMGIKTAMISGRTSKALQRRCEDLGIKHVMQGIGNKMAAAQCLLDELKLDWHNVVYMGDDWNDVPLLRKAAFSVVPADAFPEIQAHADYVTRHNAGYGAARECTDIVLYQKGLYDKAIDLYLKDKSD